MKLQIAVLVASTREGRLAPVVVDWLLRECHLEDHGRIDVIDLAVTPLPAVQQEKPVFTGEYATEAVKAFAARIDAADAFVVVTPEYNHGYPASLKLAIDSVGREWIAKPVAFVSYGGLAGGVRAIEQLRLVFAELYAVTIRNSVSLAMARSRFDEAGRLRDGAAAQVATRTMLEELTWWATALHRSRAATPFPV